MKKLVLTVGLLAGATAGFAQGTLNWSDFVPASGVSGGFSITIFSANTGFGAQNTLGNTANDLPAGTATYTGSPLSGNFEVGLYVDTSASAVQSDVLNGAPIATSSFQTGANAGTWSFASSLIATDSSIAPGTKVFVELAAWSTAVGSPTSYATAATAGDAVGYSLTGAGTTTLGGGSPPAPAGNLAGQGITDFTISGVPEPNTIALGVIGASAFLMRLRRKQ